ncbi:predicted protein [Sclerotinia sclerotiorum 1980 UF-70]|uniref:Uncharacterized protein n=1 Tax=Sclerotinia sclerotiorum (strain ATCC 18683 / 1980 / Ss-1) TaxID=665079 RepID=A7F158_SCLS1|nr:predicted protein [Sclerotinia sclerotiorum 1980 UF-70]EDN95450.1 predicted protein [Sclerotinia sclerotiorum 1980 UF-70]
MLDPARRVSAGTGTSLGITFTRPKICTKISPKWGRESGFNLGVKDMEQFCANPGFVTIAFVS